jgi:hypothetical protein
MITLTSITLLLAASERQARRASPGSRIIDLHYVFIKPLIEKGG